jgi:hypothetical protein
MLSGIGFVVFLTTAATHRFITTAESVETDELAIRAQVDVRTKAALEP